MKTPFMGQAYTVRSTNLACDRLVNLYAEQALEGKDVAAFYGTPGTVSRAEIGNGPWRALLVAKGYLYGVTQNKVYKVTPSWNGVLLGTIGSSEGPVSMAANQTQLMIVDGDNGYIVTLASNDFATITDTDFPANPVKVDFLDGYFIVNDAGTQRFYISTLNEGATWDALDFASAEGRPDNVVSLISDHRELWLFGDYTTEVWVNSGTNPDFPFERIQGAFIETGIAAPFSVAQLDNSVFWLGKDSRGQGIVWKAQGYVPARISTHAIEYAIGQYSDISDAIAYAYQDEGHTFYVLTFPTGNATWCFDAATGLWHERAYMDPDSGALGRHRSNCYAFFQGEHVVGDFEDGNLYAMDLDVYDDDGDALKALRSWPALPQGENNLNRTFQHALQIDMQSGVGLSDGQGDDPQMMLRWSDDGGHTWSNEHWRSAGAIGATGQRVIWRRLGSTEKLRSRVYEASITDPVKRAFIAAQLNASGAAS